MADYHFDELAEKAGVVNRASSPALSPAEAEQAMRKMSFRFSITDGYLTEKGGQFDYVFDFASGTWERNDWRSGVPVVSKGKLAPGAEEAFVKEASFLLTLPQTHFVTNTKSMEVNTDAYEREKYGPIKRYTRCELRMGRVFCRWVAEKDVDSPFGQLFHALQALRRSID
ncbi:hypothetical protein [Dialister sp.]|uniref:hypothetical protein n=1 Tax=Dialister sp. TaxID=1955814 RepID=UPI003F06F6EC